LTDYVRKGNPKVRKQVFIVHRLDREVSGVLLFAKNYQAKVYLQGHWEETGKRYLAVVHGKMTEPAGVFTSYLIESRSREVHSTQDKKRGRLSRTEYKVLRETRNFSLLEIHILTGRKHQIRVHLAESGHPVVGDRKYGNLDKAHKRLALHAKSISFRHPFTGESMTIEAKTSPHLERLMRRS
jgi:tRNA pseudouridine32 synthase/23S rRNA pseudouridine746 synthase/23S rRNA pseudouridine1911/1915/1917 synthase